MTIVANDDKPIQKKNDEQYRHVKDFEPMTHTIGMKYNYKMLCRQLEKSPVSMCKRLLYLKRERKRQREREKVFRNDDDDNVGRIHTQITTTFVRNKKKS